jgi:hypothetical protein
LVFAGKLPAPPVLRETGPEGVGFFLGGDFSSMFCAPATTASAKLHIKTRDILISFCLGVLAVFGSSFLRNPFLACSFVYFVKFSWALTLK